jgi:uncharacterized phage protein gp47/JayE
VYEDRTPEAIKSEIVRAISPDWDTREGSFTDDMLGPVALEISKVYGALNNVQPIVWVDETSGPYLDDAAEDLGIPPRKPGANAKVSLRIVGEAGYRIHAGSVFLTSDGLQFATWEATEISTSGDTSVFAESKGVGAVYNVPENTITSQFSNASQIESVTNPAPASGGADPESDASLFSRIDLARKKPRTSGNIYAYEAWALETPGVETARVFPLAYGRGTVMVLIADGKRKPVGQSVVEACKAHIEGSMPIGGVELTVKTPQEVVIHVEAQVATDGSATIETIQAEFQAALQQYFSNIALASYQAVYNKIGALLIGVGGVVDYTGLMLNGQAGDIILDDEQSPIVGEVALSLI